MIRFSAMESLADTFLPRSRRARRQQQRCNEPSEDDDPREFSVLRPSGWTLADDRAALTQQIKEANDIVDVVGSYVSLRPAGKIYVGLCPFHDDSRPSLRVDPDPQWQNYRCWACGKHGDVFTFVQEKERVNFPEALELLARRAGIALEKLKFGQQNPTRALMLDVMRWAASQFQECLLESS